MGMCAVMDFLPVSVEENRSERKYIWRVQDSEFVLITRQNAGCGESDMEIGFQGFNCNKEYIFRWGEDACLERTTKLGASANGKFEMKGLKQRGARYFFGLWELYNGEESCLIPLGSFRTPIRYPYGRSFKDGFKNLTQRFGQDTVVKYDLEYYSNDDSLDPVRRFLGDTPAQAYLEHIIHSIVKPGMTQMEKAIAIGAFLGAAIHHNPVHINLRETVKAMDEFASKGWKDARIDHEAVWLMELGHTRCGVINGFLSAALLRLVDIPNEVYYGCGGHTTGRVLLEGTWYHWDIDAFKGAMPLDENGRLPAIAWLKQDKNIFLLDTYPSWEDSNPDEGWTRTFDGKRMTGYTGGGRYHSETGYGSSFAGGPKEYPPSVPLPLGVRNRNGNEVLLEWIGSYDRDGNFRDYLVELFEAESGSKTAEYQTGNTFALVRLPEPCRKYYWTVKARDFHGRDTVYADRIFYTPSVRMDVPETDRNIYGSPWELISREDIMGRTRLVTDGMQSGFIRLEGFEDRLGQTNYCTTELWKIKAGRQEKPLYRLVDETNYWFNGQHVRSLWGRKLEKAGKNADGWRCTFVLYISQYSMAGISRYPLIWAGREKYHLGFGLVMDPGKGLVFTGSNIFGDWRCGKGFEPCGWFRLDIENTPGAKIVNYYLNGERIHTEDTNIFAEEVFDIDTIYISSNPEAELDFMVSDIVI